MATRLDSPCTFKVVRTDDGRLHCEAAFARDGILEYRDASGKLIRELRRPETNANPDVLETFKFLPMTIEHPPKGLLNGSSYKNHAIGMTDSSVHYDSEFGGIVGLLSMYDDTAIGMVDRGEKVELSAGYTCDVINKPGVWNGQAYDREQINVRANHLALTGRGRAGKDVCLRMDSADIDAGIGIALDEKLEERKTMTATVRCDGVEYAEVPDVFASVVGQKLTELDQLKQRVDSLEQQNSTLKAQIEETTQERNLYQGRCDGYSIIVDNADDLLENLGYERDLDGNYIRNDSEEEIKEEGNEDEVEEVEEIEEVEERTDSIPDILAAWKEADELIEGFSEVHFDSEYTVSDIKRIACAELAPEFDLSTRTDSYVDGVYGYLTSEDETEEEEEEEEVRTDSADNNYNQAIDSALRYGYRTDGCGCGGSEDDGLTEKERERKNAHKQGLTVSKKM